MSEETLGSTNDRPTHSEIDNAPSPLEGGNAQATPSMNQASLQQPEHHRVLEAVVLQSFILLGMALISWLAARAHGYDWPIPSAEGFANFDFVGVSPENPEPSFLALAFEVLGWSAVGVLARSEYCITRRIARGENFDLLETISKLIGDFAMGVSIAVAVVAFLRSTEFVTLSLKSAGIEAIAAISFILGFYHEDTRRLLGPVKEAIPAFCWGDENERTD